jgi:putative oxidoreductase
VRRLFSTFARGRPGMGLLLLRIVVGVALIWCAVQKVHSVLLFQVIVLCVLATGGLLLLVGLWTPLAGTLVAAVELSSFSCRLGDPWTYILLGTIAAALALVGPGHWSVDARIYGWKRIEPSTRNS